MNNIIALVVFSFVLQYNVNAQCDSVFVAEIDIPQIDSLNIVVSINNTSSTHHIYLDLSLTDDLTDLVIAESTGGYLQLYPNQISTFELDTTVIFGQWQLYYAMDEIPEISNISVGLTELCDSIAWENSLAISESIDPSQALLFPNPASQFLFIDGYENFTYSIFNSLGKEVINSTTETGEINIQSLSRGVYFVRIKDVEDSRTFIKE